MKTTIYCPNFDLQEIHKHLPSTMYALTKAHGIMPIMYVHTFTTVIILNTSKWTQPFHLH